MKSIAILAGLILLMGMSTADSAELQLEEDYPVLGEGVKVYLTGQTDPTSVLLTAVYRPNSATTVEKTIGAFRENGSVVWKPEEPGITTLIAKGADGTKTASKNVAVRFPSTPASGVIVMALAGILLFGGAGWSLRNALRE